jgi:hypothetical protein
MQVSISNEFDRLIRPPHVAPAGLLRLAPRNSPGAYTGFLIYRLFPIGGDPRSRCFGRRHRLDASMHLHAPLEMHMTLFIPSRTVQAASKLDVVGCGRCREIGVGAASLAQLHVAAPLRSLSCNNVIT